MKKIKFFTILILLFVSLVLQIYSQEKQRVYEVSSKYVSFILTDSPKCPLQLNDPKFVDYEKGTFEKIYTVTNRTDKSIKSFQIKELSWFGNQEYTKGGKAQNNLFFQPHESFSTFSNKDELEFVNFDDHSAVKLGLNSQPKNIWIILVTKVELSDGTIYDISSKYEIIEKYIQKLEISPKMSLSEIDSKENELREFIKKMLN